MVKDPQHAVAPVVSPVTSPRRIDTTRALCHDLRQPLVGILLLARTEGGDVRRRFDGIIEEAEWLLDMVEAVLGGAAEDTLSDVEVVDLVAHCVQRAVPTAGCEIGLIGADRAMAVAAPVALSRAVGCLLDNAVRAAGPGGHVSVEVNGTDSEVTVRVTDDGPGLGHVPTENSLGLTITRALVSTCGGAFDLKPGAAGGVVARIVLSATRSMAVS
jgi:signal transduction histidine kinase